MGDFLKEKTLLFNTPSMPRFPCSGKVLRNEFLGCSSAKFPEKSFIG
jgi:hypothetical protein